VQRTEEQQAAVAHMQAHDHVTARAGRRDRRRDRQRLALAGAQQRRRPDLRLLVSLLLQRRPPGRERPVVIGLQDVLHLRPAGHPLERRPQRRRQHATPDPAVRADQDGNQRGVRLVG